MKESVDPCPVCDRPFESEGEMRAHVLVNHHKSEIVDRLVAENETETREPILARKE